jgi:hypothetical protein
MITMCATTDPFPAMSRRLLSIGQQEQLLEALLTLASSAPRRERTGTPT